MYNFRLDYNNNINRNIVYNTINAHNSERNRRAKSGRGFSPC